VTDALVVSNLLLWLMVVVLAGVVFALARQIGVLHERVAPAGALLAGGGPAPGQPAPVVEVLDWDGGEHRVGAPRADGRSTLLFFLSPTCPVCKTLLPVLESVRVAERGWLDVLLASAGPRREHEAFLAAHGLEAGRYLLSEQLGLRYRVGQLPFAVLIDAGGVVRAAGLVNTREHLESLFEAHELGAASVQEFLRRREEERGRDAPAARRASGGSA
jgi:methylamine dehydrogenase accessory protein MauD